MARRKKNAFADLEAKIAEKKAEEGNVLSEIESIKEGIENAKAALKEKKSALKSVQKELARLDTKLKKAELVKDEELKKQVIQKKIKEMVASGASYTDILNKLD